MKMDVKVNTQRKSGKVNTKVVFIIHRQTNENLTNMKNWSKPIIYKEKKNLTRIHGYLDFKKRNTVHVPYDCPMN